MNKKIKYAWIVATVLGLGGCTTMESVNSPGYRTHYAYSSGYTSPGYTTSYHRGGWNNGYSGDYYGNGYRYRPGYSSGVGYYTNNVLYNTSDARYYRHRHYNKHHYMGYSNAMYYQGYKRYHRNHLDYQTGQINYQKRYRSNQMNYQNGQSSYQNTQMYHQKQYKNNMVNYQSSQSGYQNGQVNYPKHTGDHHHSQVNYQNTQTTYGTSGPQNTQQSY